MRKKHRTEKVKKVLCQICGREYFPKGIKSHEAAHRREAQGKFEEDNEKQVEVLPLVQCFNLLTMLENKLTTKLRKVEIDDKEWSLKVYLTRPGVEGLEE